MMFDLEWIFHFGHNFHLFMQRHSIFFLSLSICILFGVAPIANIPNGQTIVKLAEIISTNNVHDYYQN